MVSLLQLNNLFLILYQIDLLVMVIISLIASIILIKNKSVIGYLLLIGTLLSLIPLVILVYINIISEPSNQLIGLLNNLTTFIGIPTLIVYLIGAFKLKKVDSDKGRKIGIIQLIALFTLLVLLIAQFFTLRF